MMYNGGGDIDSLNPEYSGKLGHGRIYIAYALSGSTSSSTN